MKRKAGRGLFVDRNRNHAGAHAAPVHNMPLGAVGSTNADSVAHGTAVSQCAREALSTMRPNPL